MDEHKRNILIIAATTAAIILLAGVNIAHILATSTPRTSEAEETTSTAAIGGTGTSAPKRKTAVEHQKPLEVCERLAPKAAAAYTSKGEDRDRLVKRYFTADAQGLNIPTDRIAEQPDVQASGGMNAGTVMNQAEKHQYGDARSRPAPRDRPGWSRIRRSSRPRAPAPRSCRTMPAAARRVPEIAHCSLPSSCGRTNPEREVSPSSRPAWIPSRYGKSPLI